MKAEIIIILENDTIKTQNFLKKLSMYSGIEQYKIIFAIEKKNRKKLLGMIKKYFSQEQDIKYYLVDKINNYGKIYNGAAEMVTEHAIIFIKTDIILEQDCLNVLIKTLEEDDIMAVQPLIIGFHSLRIQSAGELLTDIFISSVLGNQKEENRIMSVSDKRVMLSMEIFAINRYVFEELKGFDEELTDKWQVRELTMRLTAMGGVNYCVEKAKVYSMHEHKNLYHICPLMENYKLYKRITRHSFLEIENLFKKQKKYVVLKKEYIIINFSNLSRPQKLFEDINIHIKKVLDYTQVAHKKKIIFEDFLQWSLLEESTSFIYFANNMIELEMNGKWFQLRSKKEDLFADLSGNLIPVNGFQGFLEEQIMIDES